MDYKIGIYEKAMPSGQSWEAMLTQAKAAGFDYMEVSVDETDDRLARLDFTPAQRAGVRRAMENAGLSIRSMCLSGHRKFPLGSRDAETRRRSLEIMDKALELSCELGVRIIQLAGYDVYYEEGGADTRAWFSENLQKCAEMAAKYGVVLGFETMETEFMDTVGKAMEYVRAVDSPYLQVYPDLGNLTNAAVKYGHDVLDDIRAGQGHLVAMHLKETVPGVYRDMMFGEGHVAFAPAIAQALKMGVRMFVTECWYAPSLDIAQVRRFADAKFIEAEAVKNA